MASSGTLLSDLDGNGGGGGMGGDTDLVKKIFAEMNTPGQANPMMGGNNGGGMIMSPNPNTTAQMTMDSAPPTSHIIGKEHPTPADFAAAMHGVPRSPDGGMALPPPMSGSANMAPANSGWAPYGNVAAPSMPMMIPDPVESTKKNLYARIADELKTPILVSILVFVFSLPFLNVLFSHYIPSLIKPTGDLTHIGLLVKAALAGTTFWTLQRVIAPLVSL
jgi:hypothetical protein